MKSFWPFRSRRGTKNVVCLVQPMLEQQRRRYAEDEFPDWAALRALWAERIREVAREVRDGVAAVVFEKAGDLDYCEVKPLLRLAERKVQFKAEGE